MDVASDFHALGLSVDAADEQKEQGFLHILVTVDLRSDGTSQLVVKIVLGHLTVDSGGKREKREGQEKEKGKRG